MIISHIMGGCLVDYEFILKLTIALILGLLIGIDRQIKHKPIGVKTSMVICVSSCLITVVSIEAAYIFPVNDGIMMDPFRLAAQIVSGIGFLGAGVILKRNNDVIIGLTTAAMIWGAAGIGIAVGAGFYYEAGYTVILLIIALNFVSDLIKKFGPSPLREKEVSVIINFSKSEPIDSMISRVENKIKEVTLKYKIMTPIRYVKIRDDVGDRNQFEIIFSLSIFSSIDEVYSNLKEIKPVVSIVIEEL